MTNYYKRISLEGGTGTEYTHISVRLDMFINPQLTYKKLIKRRWSVQGSYTLPKHVLRK